MLFADDLQIYFQCRFSEFESAISKLNEDAAAIVKWTSDNGLILNVRKTKATLFASIQHHMRIDVSLIPPIIVDGTIIPLESSVKNVGIIFTKDLTWNKHASSVTSRVHGVPHNLKFRGSFLGSAVKMMLVNALVIPHFDYAYLVTYSMPDYVAIKLWRLFNVAVRFFNLRRDMALEPYYIKLGGLLPDMRRKYFLGVLIYKILTTAKPDYLKVLFRIDNDLRRLERLKSIKFVIPSTTTETYIRSFSITSMNF